MGKTKIHYAEIDRATESDNQNYWERTLCGLSEHDVEVTDKIEFVSCKKCIKAFPKYKKSVDNHLGEYYE